MARDARAVVIHGNYMNSVVVPTCKGLEVTGEVRGLTADIVLITVCRHCVLHGTQTGRPRHKSSVVGTLHYHRDISGNAWHCR